MDQKPTLAEKSNGELRQKSTFVARGRRGWGLKVETMPDAHAYMIGYPFPPKIEV